MELLLPQFLFSPCSGFSLPFLRNRKTERTKPKKVFPWIKNETVSASLADGFMTDAFIRDLTAICQKSRLLSAVVINTPSGAVFAWPQNSSENCVWNEWSGTNYGNFFFHESVQHTSRYWRRNGRFHHDGCLDQCSFPKFNFRGMPQFFSRNTCASFRNCHRDHDVFTGKKRSSKKQQCQESCCTE